MPLKPEVLSVGKLFRSHGVDKDDFPSLEAHRIDDKTIRAGLGRIWTNIGKLLKSGHIDAAIYVLDAWQTEDTGKIKRHISQGVKLLAGIENPDIEVEPNLSASVFVKHLLLRGVIVKNITDDMLGMLYCLTVNCGLTTLDIIVQRMAMLHDRRPTAMAYSFLDLLEN